MAEYGEDTSIPTLIRGLLDDARSLVREELQLARAELREEATQMQTVAVAFGIAAVVGLIGAAVLSVAIGSLIAYYASWPVWIGYGVVGIVWLVCAWIAVAYARGRLRDVRAIPNTAQTMKENMTWMQNKSASR